MRMIPSVVQRRRFLVRKAPRRKPQRAKPTRKDLMTPEFAMLLQRATNGFAGGNGTNGSV